MVFSVRANKKRILAVLVLLAIVACGIIFIPKMVTAPMKHYGETPEQRLEFLKSYGWEVSAEPIDSRDVTIPKEFSDVYTKYNIMQKAQGFDLKPYSGMVCRQYIYLVENYPENKNEVHATLLVYEGVIVGGDISCAEVDGFMHGFAADSARYGEAPKEGAESPEPKSSEEPKSQAESSTVSEGAATGAELQTEQTEAGLTENGSAEGGEQQTEAQPTEEGQEEQQTEAQPETADEETGAQPEAEDYPTD